MERLRRKSKLSVYMITFNNERTVGKALSSVQWADEIIVVDSFSTDRTLEICRKFTPNVFQRKWTGHRDQYQFAADLTTHEWIMFVDADEEVPPDLAGEIRKQLEGETDGADGFFVYRQTYYLGRWIRYGGWYPDGEIRLYRREKGRWEGGLHAKLAVDGKIVVLKNKYFHYNYRDISDQIQTIDKYSRIAAQDMVESGEKFSIFRMLFNPPFRFIKEYLLKSGFRDGLPGLVIIVSTMYYVFIKYAKLWELTRSTASSRSFEEEGAKGRSGSTLSQSEPSGSGPKG